MTATGMGASVRRKEDHRFITGKGQLYRRHQPPGPGPRLFPALAARACRHQAIDIAAARKMPGVVDVFTGQDLADDKSAG